MQSRNWCSVEHWLLTPMVVGPPPWEVLIVMLAFVNVPSGLRTGVLPITTSPWPSRPTVPNRFWPDAARRVELGAPAAATPRHPC
jgi:hypothetical protein